MRDVIIVIDLLVILAMIGVILMQRSEGGALGIGGSGGSGGGMSGFLSGRGTANLLTRTTAILAAAFMILSLLLTILAGNVSERRSIVEELPTTSGDALPSLPSTGDQPVQPPADDGSSVPVR